MVLQYAIIHIAYPPPKKKQPKKKIMKTKPMKYHKLFLSRVWIHLSSMNMATHHQNNICRRRGCLFYCKSNVYVI